MEKGFWLSLKVFLSIYSSTHSRTALSENTQALDLLLMGFLFCAWLSGASIAVVKQHDQSQLAREEGVLLHLTTLKLHSSMRDRSSRQEPGRNNWSRGYAGVLLTGLHLINYSACFPIKPKTTLGVVPPTVRRPLTPQLSIKKRHHRLTYR